MKRPLKFALGLLAALGLAGCLGRSQATQDEPSPPVAAQLEPDAQAAAQALSAFGVNLGHATQWGAEQLLANVLHNPGFEGISDASLFTVGSVAEPWLTDAAAWAARPEHFWTGARWEVRTGAATGRAGKVLAHLGTVGQSQRLQLDALPPMLVAGDVLALLREDDPTPAPLWWRESGRFESVALPRPGSPGRQALKMAGPARLSHYLDGITERAGKLLPVQGRWRLAVWARSEGAGSQAMQLRFGRLGSPLFLNTQAMVTPEWQRLEWEFSAQDSGPAGPLALSLEISQGSVLLDDASLEAVGAATPGGFRPEVLSALKALQPGVLRDWQGQLGAPLANRLAPPLARRPARYRAGEHEAQHHYGLEEFLALSAAVGARPWIVGAPTWSQREWTQLGEWLTRALDRHGLPGAIVEFGNESWNPLFRPAAMDATPTLGQASDRAFKALMAGAGQDARILPTLGAQSARPGHAQELARSSPAIASLALGPYLAYEAREGEPPEAMLARWFAESFEVPALQMRQVAALGRVPVVYEVNLHTLDGQGSTAARNAALASPAAGVLLARQLLRASLAGARYQAVYALAGFDAHTAQKGELARLFGITQDLAGPEPRLRPTGQALAMLNRVARHSLRPATCAGAACKNLEVAYMDAGQAVALVSSADHPLTLSLRIPCAEGPPRVQTLSAQGQAEVGECRRQRLQVKVPAHSLVTVSTAP